jgi:hypothetical protein
MKSTVGKLAITVKPATVGALAMEGTTAANDASNSLVGVTKDR